MVGRSRRAGGCGLAACALLAALVPGAPRAQSPLEVRDPVYGEMLFDFYVQDYFQALVRTLVELQREAAPPDPFGGRLAHNRDDARLLLGGLSLAYGMPATARRAFDELLAERVDPVLQRKAWYFIARLAHEQGRPAEAEQALRRSLDGATPALAAPRRLLLAQVLMARQRYAQAAAELSDWQGSARLAPYAAYNRGVALVRGGEAEAGIEALATVATTTGEVSAERAALADRARLALGFHLLRDQAPGRAAEYLQGVRLQGPFSNRALLGAGWAASAAGNHQAALIPWLELQARATPEAAVLESQLAIPYAYARLALHGRAAEGYGAAEAHYLAEQAQVDGALVAVDEGQLIPALLAQTESLYPGVHRRAPVEPVTATRHLVTLLASHRFRRALRNFRDLRAARANLARWRDYMGAFDDMLATRRGRYEAVLPKVAARVDGLDLDALRARQAELRERLRRYRLSADQVALAPAAQQSQYARVMALGERLERLPFTAEVEAALAAQERLRGVLLWQFSFDAAANRWRLERELREVDAALDRAQALAERVREARQAVPATFAGFGRRMDGLGERLARAARRTGQLLVRQDAQLRELARVHLRDLRQRLDRYLLHARFGRAQNLDLLYETRTGAGLP